MADAVMAAQSRTRNICRTLATSFDEAELDLNEDLHKIHQLVAASGPATGALSYVTEDRMDNERKYLQILEMIQNEGNRVGKRDDAAGEVAHENPEMNTGSNRVVSLNLRVVLVLSECVGVVVLSTCERLLELGLDASHRSPLLSRRFGHMGGLPFPRTATHSSHMRYGS